MLKSEWITSSDARSRLTSACHSSLSLRLATGAGDADAERARRDVSHLARRERVAHDVGDHVRRLLGLARSHGARRSDRLGDRPTLFVRDDGVRLRSAAVDANYDERHIRSLAAARAGDCCVSE